MPIRLAGRNCERLAVDRMADIVNLRKARKQAKRKTEEKTAQQNRALYGRTRAERSADAARRETLNRTLDGHLIERGEGE